MTIIVGVVVFWEFRDAAVTTIATSYENTETLDTVSVGMLDRDRDREIVSRAGKRLNGRSDKNPNQNIRH